MMLLCHQSHLLTSDFGHLGGSGEIRTHGPISRSTVFKTVAINRTLPRFHNGVPGRI